MEVHSVFPEPLFFKDIFEVHEGTGASIELQKLPCSWYDWLWEFCLMAAKNRLFKLPVRGKDLSTGWEAERFVRDRDPVPVVEAAEKMEDLETDIEKHFLHNSLLTWKRQLTFH